MTREHSEPVFPSMQQYEDAYNKGEAGTLGLTTLRQMIIKRNTFQKAYLDSWSATAVEGKGAMNAIIVATAPWSAPRLGVTQKMFCVNYTGFITYLVSSFEQILWIWLSDDL